MREINLENGATVKIESASFQDAIDLKNAIVKQVAQSGLDLKNINFQTELSGEFLNSIIKSVLFVDCSKEVNECLFKCMARCTYNKEKITVSTFDKVDARENYYVIIAEIIKENVFPFFKGAVSGFKTLMQFVKN